MSKKDNWTTAEVIRLPKCDFCENDAEYDAQMQGHTMWANYCENHFRTNSIGRLGMGLGQKLILVREEQS